MTGDRGFSIVEVAVAMGLLLGVAAVVFALIEPGQASYSVQLESADMQQRLRVAAGTLSKDLIMAGAGTSRGPHPGPMSYFFAPILPYRHGADDSDPPGSFRRDTITVMYVPATFAQATIATAGPSGALEAVQVNHDPGCPVDDPSCGFRRGMTVLIYDAAGDYDTFTVAGADAATLQLESTRSTLTYPGYPPGTPIAELVHIVYSLKPDPISGSNRLVATEGGAGAQVPVVDHVAGLTFTYYGDPRPPVLTANPLGEPPGPWTTYGPAPPRFDEHIPSGTYPNGENCAFAVDVVGGVHVPRLPSLAPADTNGRVPIGESVLTDGPWCPDPTNAHRWDADLLRIRSVAVTIRIESANTALRGPAGVLFARGGTSRSGNRWLPDQEVTFEVSPRNLGR